MGENEELAAAWERVYAEKFMTVWWPDENIVRFCARFIQKRMAHDTYEVKRKVDGVLDLGCGNGRHVVFFGHNGLRVAGIDIAPTTVEWAREWCCHEGIAADLRVGSVLALPFENASFDVVVSHGVLDHMTMDEARRTAREVERVIRPGGLFYCDLRASEDCEAGQGREVGPNTRILDEGYEQGLVQHFFTLIEVEDLFAGAYRLLYTERADRWLGPTFQRRYSRWVIAAERG